MRDIVEILKEAGYGVVEGEKAVKDKIQEIGSRTDRRMPFKRPEKPVGAFK